MDWGHVITIIGAIVSAAGFTAGFIFWAFSKFHNDIKALSDRTDSQIKALSGDIKALSDRTDSQIKALSDKTDSQIKALSGDIKALSNKSESDINAWANKLEGVINAWATKLEGDIKYQGIRMEQIQQSIHDVDKRVYGIEMILHMKECCVLSQEQKLKKAE